MSASFREAMFTRGADLAGFGDLTGLQPETRENMPVGVSVAMKYPADVIRCIADLPTQEYFDWYNLLNEKLDGLVTFGAEFLRSAGYRAIAQTRAQVGASGILSTALPHKTVATRAGIGWIGKCALLVTEVYGSMIRLSSILTDAPLGAARPVNDSKCGGCRACTDACPAGAVSGREWSAGLCRDEFFDAPACQKTARERARLGFGADGVVAICGRCIAVCPYTLGYLEQS